MALIVLPPVGVINAGIIRKHSYEKSQASFNRQTTDLHDIGWGWMVRKVCTHDWQGALYTLVAHTTATLCACVQCASHLGCPLTTTDCIEHVTALRMRSRDAGKDCKGLGQRTQWSIHCSKWWLRAATPAKGGYANWKDYTTKNTVTARRVRINMSILASHLVQGAEYDQTRKMKSLGPKTVNSINEPSCILNIKWVHGYLEHE